MGVSPERWFRLCVDVDEQGHPIGASLEVHQGEACVAITVEPQPGPFDTPHEVLDSVLATSYRYTRLTLFP